MYRAFWFSTDAGAYWSVVDDESYDAVELVDRFLQYVRFGRGRSESTTRKYAESIALYYNFCSDRSASWADPDITAFQVWADRAVTATPPPLETGMGRSRTRSSPQ